MVMDISIETVGNDIPFDNTTRYYTYTVHANHHRILTVVTTSSQTLSKWLNQFSKSTTKKNNHPILVGVSADTYLQNTKRGAKDQPYDIITLCVGSHCLIYHLDTREDLCVSRDLTPNKSLRAFFENPSVIAIGMEIETIAMKIGIKIKNAVDLRRMAAEGLKKKGEQLDLTSFNLDKVAVTVLGNQVDVVRPKEKVKWYDWISFWWRERELTMEKVQFSTIDAYLCFLVGSELHNMIHGSGTEDETKSKNKSGKKEKKKRGNAMN